MPRSKIVPLQRIFDIRLEGFKSYRSATLQFSPLTLLIGANASGKSNALEAIRLLSWLAKGIRLDDIERKIQGTDSLIRGQAESLFFDESYKAKIGCHVPGIYGDWNILELEFGLIDEHLILTDERISSLVTNGMPLYQVNSSPNSHTDEVKVLYNNFKRGGNKPQIPCSNRQAIFYQLETPARFSHLHKESQNKIPKATKIYREVLSSIVFLDPKPSLMRGYSYEKDNEIKEDGSNLSSVLYAISKMATELENKLYYEYLLDFVRSLPEQNIKKIDFIETERKDVMVRLMESFGGNDRYIDAPLLSDGTLRVLAVAAALLTAPKGALVIIEEIDNGIHPNRAELLIERILKIAQLRELQVLLTTHNPALLDVLPDHALGDVICCYRDPDEGDSRIVQLKNLPNYPELAAQGPLGQLVTKGILDRFLKDKSTIEERKKNSLEWLEQYKTEVAK